jgi:chorismate-pyruvate lyase
MLFGEAGLETRRELLYKRASRCLPGDAEQLEVGRSTPVFERGYRIISGSRPLALVVERIPATIFEERR